MASLTIRNLDDQAKARLRVAAARAGHSMEEHVRLLIENEVRSPTLPDRGFGTWMKGLFEGGTTAGFTVPARKELAEPMVLP